VKELKFKVEGARAEPYAAVPTLSLALRIEDDGGATVNAVALRCQIRIEPQRRRYSDEEEARLAELFGETPRWGDTLKPFLWTNVSQMVTAFEGSTLVQMPVQCTYDFEIAATKYLHSLDDGEIPLLLLFSGTVFTRDGAGLQASQVPWHAEASYRLPVKVWRTMMDLYFPNSGWLMLRRETLDQLMKLKATLAMPTWDDVIDALMSEARANRQ
jgi:hypothetical protein